MREQSLGMCVVGTAYTGRLGGEDRNPIRRCFKAGGRQGGRACKSAVRKGQRCTCRHMAIVRIQVAGEASKPRLEHLERNLGLTAQHNPISGLSRDSLPFYCSSTNEGLGLWIYSPKKFLPASSPGHSSPNLMLGTFCDICQCRGEC